MGGKLAEKEAEGDYLQRSADSHFFVGICLIQKVKPLNSEEEKMAAGVIQTLSKFRLPTEFQHPFLTSIAGQEMSFQYFSGEDDTEEEEEDEAEEEGREEMELEEDLVSSAHEDATMEVNPSVNNTKKTLQLLQFAERISNDIQKYFGKKNKGQDEEEEVEESSCNAYEDFYSPPLPGRAISYTDLIRISQHGEMEDEEDSSDSHKTFEQLWRSLCGKDEKLGPLAELFEYGFCRCLQRHLSPDNKKLMRLERKFAHVTPMQSRKLPQSFWREPTVSPIGTPNGNPPDFSDLLANWTSESGQEELNASREHLGEVTGDGH
ncbi:LOW QUALITY PROTEIN: protein PERCC1 [Pituophis catenifer annectens]|uniref:LOW QUALITY PROTEIN: protein PERCC1 n=1 Tax=Pituophis catenifer annectens TaxID=94852 RepID=UPI00399475DB